MRRAFSLIELLLAVFILGIGIISIAAIFPAGIAQQQMAADEQMGPVVADAAINVVRSKVRPGDFGNFEQFGVLDIGSQSGAGVWRPSPGDWSWMRPAVLGDLPSTSADETGWVDLFSNYAWFNGGGGSTLSLEEFPSGVTSTVGGGVVLRGIPYNASAYGAPPPVTITQKERYWPMAADGLVQRDPPQYSWDVMFRKFGGKVQVAIFVYRVVAAGGSPRPYVAQALSAGGTGRPPVPYRRITESGGTQTGTWPPVIPAAWQQTPPPALGASIQPSGPYSNGMLGAGIVNVNDFPSNSATPQHAWQLPGQWLLDSSGDVLRVSIGRRLSAVDPPFVRLTAPVRRTPSAQVFSDYEAPTTVAGVRALWYVPALDSAGNQLIPVYVTVRDL